MKRSPPPQHTDDPPDPRTPPSVQFAWALGALRWYYAPEFLHLERVHPKRPSLFVGNHSVLNVFDAMLFADALYREKGIVLRPLADRAHFKIPLWRDLVVQQGGVLGTRENCATLMRRGEHILVFPGGGREVFKRKGEAYRLTWKDRYGFVRLAIEHGYTITPYATAGAEESFDVLLDAGDYLRSPVDCKHLLRETFMATYVDGLSDIPLDRLIAFHKSHSGLATITSVPLRSQYGTMDFDASGRITGFKEKPVLREHWINAGFFVFDHEVFDHWEGENLEREVFPNLVKKGMLYAYQHDGFFKSMDTYKDQQEIEQMCQEGRMAWKRNAKVAS